MPRRPTDPSAERERALAMFNVSRETITRLDQFIALLLAWQHKTNLISSSTIPSLWSRHVADSLQLLQLVPMSPRGNSPVWLDLGSGGGFPGIVIACWLADIPGACVHLVESNMRKAAFLREAIRRLSAPGIVHATRIETLDPELGGAVNYVTARALAPLADLLEMIAPFLKKGAKALLPKGQDLDNELTEATKHWKIEADQVPSRISQSGRILIVHTLERRSQLRIRRAPPSP
jgi:16S rRNA (guanine527-N7)-methyltransferase